MQQHGPAGRIVRFGSFEVDLQEGRLTKAGIRIRLQGQPLQILVLLLQSPGQLVTREEIRQKLWSRDTFVEFDDALNTAVRKLRAALNDSADNPRFLETVPRRGYRFVAPVVWMPEPAAVAAMESGVRRLPHNFYLRFYFWLAAALIVAGAATLGYRHSRRFCQHDGRSGVRRYLEDGTGRFPAAIAVFECALRQRSGEDVAANDPS